MITRSPDEPVKASGLAERTGPDRREDWSAAIPWVDLLVIPKRQLT